MSIFDRALKRIEDNMGRDINCIPWGLPRFEVWLPGIIKKRYYLITASQGVSKSQFTNAMFVYNVYDFVKKNPGVKAKIFYWSMEIDAETMILQGISRRLFMQYGIIADTTRLLSFNNSNRCSQELFDLVKTVREYFEGLEDMVEIYEENINPYGIKKRLFDYAKDNGKIYEKSMPFTKDDGTVENRPVFDYYVANNPDEYVISIADHLALLNLEKTFSGVKDTKSTIEKHSNNNVEVRNKFGFIPVDIQQQASSTESNDSFKLNKLEPSIQGLGESKLVGRNIDIGLGLFSPARHEIPTYKGYNIGILRDNYRFLQIIKNRHGESNVYTHLYFNGAVNYFKELPKDITPEMYKNIHTLMLPN